MRGEQPTLDSPGILWWCVRTVSVDERHHLCLCKKRTHVFFFEYCVIVYIYIHIYTHIIFSNYTYITFQRWIHILMYSHRVFFVGQDQWTIWPGIPCSNHPKQLRSPTDMETPSIAGDRHRWRPWQFMRAFLSCLPRITNIHIISTKLYIITIIYQ